MATENFLFLVGAPKCGTTSLASWLNAHSKIALIPGKEPGYFRSNPPQLIIDAHNPDKPMIPKPDSNLINRDSYLRTAREAEPDQWVLDASTDYLSDDDACSRIYEFAQERQVKLFCLLRDPVERSLSEYRHTLRDGLEPLTFRDSLSAEETRRAQGYQPLFFHVRRSLLFDDIKHYQRLFGDAFKLFSMSDIEQEERFAQELFAHIGIPHQDLGPIAQENATLAKPGNGRQASPLRRFYRSLRETVKGERKPVVKHPITDEERQLINDLLADDIAKCVADPSIPTDDWTCPAAVAARGATQG